MKILPFRGYRYNPEIIGRLDDVISPPYDQFKEGLDDLLFARHRYNMAHLIVNKQTLRVLLGVELPDVAGGWLRPPITWSCPQPAPSSSHCPKL